MIVLMMSSEYPVPGSRVPDDQVEGLTDLPSDVWLGPVHAGSLGQQTNTVLHEWREGPGNPHYGGQCGLHQQESLPGWEDIQEGREGVESLAGVAESLGHGAHDGAVGT